MGFFQDMVKVFTKKELTYKGSIQESDGVYTFQFEMVPGLTWDAGQYGLFTITHTKVKSATKPFSISSAPAEQVVQITTRVGDNPSEFKQALLELKPGMTIKMGGPVGAFKLDEGSPSLLIAGGIGITPFRAILKQMEADGMRNLAQIHLLYLDSNQLYLFKDELDAIAGQTGINVKYLGAREELLREIDNFADTCKDKGKYYLAGPKSLVDSIAADLQGKQIPKRNVKKDAFFGY